MLNKHFTQAALYMKCMIACIPSEIKLEGAIEPPDANQVPNENATDCAKRLFKWIEDITLAAIERRMADVIWIQVWHLVKMMLATKHFLALPSDYQRFYHFLLSIVESYDWSDNDKKTKKEERWEGAQIGHIMAMRRIYAPLSSLFMCFSFFLLFLLDSNIALESKTSSLFLSFSCSASLYLIIITKVNVIVPL
jgi:hypothetical protein